LLTKAIIQSIQDRLDVEKIQNMNKKLETDHGLKFEEIFNKYDDMRSSLHQFETDLKNIEDNILRNFLTIEKTIKNDTWILVRDKHLAEMILKTFADGDKKMILDLTRDQSETVPRVLSLCNLPNTSGYRKMNQLIDEGFVVPVGLAESFEGKRAILYKSLIQKIQITINRDNILTAILVPKETLRSSQVINTVLLINQNHIEHQFN
jgi:hypothetical protein